MLHTPEELSRRLKEIAVSILWAFLFILIITTLVGVLAFKDAQAADTVELTLEPIDQATLDVWMAHHDECRAPLLSAPSMADRTKHVAVYFKCMSITYNRASKKMLDAYHANPEVEL